MKNKSSNISVGMGGSLIVTVFIILCLMIFAVLSFMTAYWDLNLSNKAQSITEDYYIVHGKAEEKLSEINDVLYVINSNILNEINKINETNEINETSKTNENKVEINERRKINENIIDELNNIDGVLVINENELIIQYEETGNYNQKITVTLNLLQKENKYYYEIKTWNLSNIELPIYEDSIDIWEGI